MKVLYIDGGSRGHPGPAGYGVHIEDDDDRLANQAMDDAAAGKTKTAKGQTAFDF